MRLSSSIVLSVIALTLASGCRSSNLTEVSYEPETQGIQAGFVSVTPAAAGLVVVNQTERPVYFIAFERETGTRTDFRPCTGGVGCPTVAQGESVTYPWSSVLGAAPDRPSYLLYWWHTVTGSDGTIRAGTMQNVSVTR